MGNHHTPVDVDPQAVKHAEQLWHNFTRATTFVIVSSAVILCLMAFFLVD